VNECLQSVSNPAVYAGGDAAASGPPLTSKATHDAEVLTTTLLEGNRRTPRYDGIASACFTLPPIASAGLAEEAARTDGRRFRASWQDTSGWFNTLRVGETVSAFKVLIEEDTGRILGAHLLGPHAEEVINLFSLAIRLGIPADELKRRSSSIRPTAGHPLHGLSRADTRQTAPTLPDCPTGLTPACGPRSDISRRRSNSPPKYSSSER
jgi:glutathione reductase (NADPH)